MSSSEDDRPLVGLRISNGHKSSETIPKSVDTAMDKSQMPVTNGIIGISIRNGPKDDMDLETPQSNGFAKRKSRGSMKPTYKETSAGSEDDDIPLKKRRVNSKAEKSPTSASASMPIDSTPSQTKKIKDESEDSDIPLGKSLAKEKQKIQNRAEKEAKAIRRTEDKNAKTDQSLKKGSEGRGGRKESGTSASARGDLKKTKATSTSKKGKIKQHESDIEDREHEEEEYRWWEDPSKGDGSIKWTTLEHNGVVFPPPYEPLPGNVKMLYNGTPVSMSEKAEEVAVFFGNMLNSTHNVENPTFQKNFFGDFTEILKKSGGARDNNQQIVPIKEFAKCDFSKIFEHFDAQRIAKKSLSQAEKKQIKAEKDEAEARYLYCIWDGRKQKVGNFRVEPPGLFRGRGEHPKTGHVKSRVEPEQITINIGKDAMVPAPPDGHKWKEIKHDQEGTWLAMWQENINGNYKYVMLAANSDVKGQSDYKKFEKARELKKHIDHIRKHYTKELKDEMTANRQRATAMYLIDQFALRAGNEKGEDEADTVGCCSLKFEHITLRPPNTVIFDFLGKDSIRFYDEVQVTEQVFKNLRIFKKSPKTTGDDIFDRLTTSALNKHLSSFMPGLTAKVFRTYNASFTFSNLLRDMKSSGSIAEKIKDYNEANKKVAILCNHKRTVTAGHGAQMEKLGDRMKALQYQKWRTKQMMLDLDPKLKKKKGDKYFALDHDIDEEWIREHQAYLVTEERKKIEKKFAKDNEKLVTEGSNEMKPKELRERLDAADELAKKFERENKSRKIEAEGKGASIERLESQIEKYDQRVAIMRLQAEDKESNKEVALGTSKINYIDPRLTVVFSKKFGVPIEKFFSKTLREKFDWAIKSAEEDWTF